VGGDVVLDRESGFGTARHARLEVGRVPVFYWPWVRFPIDDRRQTGFLWPAVGLSADALDYAQPFYWNIAPDQDATITPRWITDRGLLLGGEYRYLLPSDAGQIEGAFLGSDDGGSSDNPNDAARRFEGEDRWYVDYRHAGTLNPRSRYRLRYGAASDGRYFDDFGSDFAEQNTSAMSRLAQIDYRGDTWRLDARAQGFQKLDDPLLRPRQALLPAAEPHRRCPLDPGQRLLPAVALELHLLLARRGREPRPAARVRHRLPAAPVAGHRLALRRELGLPGAAPGVAGHRLRARLRQPRHRPRHLPDPRGAGGLGGWRPGLRARARPGGRGYRQTLEPRVNYAYVPARDQSEFPDFDTSERAFSWNQLWSPYRFSGSDRVGDLNRLSLGVESRLLEDASGRERLSLGVGQAIYFDDRTIDMATATPTPCRTASAATRTGTAPPVTARRW
jgi:LPS-assembly protein